MSATQPESPRSLGQTQLAPATPTADPAHTLADLLERASGYYHPKFDQLIERLNTVPTATSQGECIRLCVEAVNLVLQTQSQIAGELRRLERRTHLSAKPLPIRRSA